MYHCVYIWSTMFRILWTFTRTSRLKIRACAFRCVPLHVVAYYTSSFYVSLSLVIITNDVYILENYFRVLFFNFYISVSYIYICVCVYLIYVCIYFHAYREPVPRDYREKDKARHLCFFFSPVNLAKTRLIRDTDDVWSRNNIVSEISIRRESRMESQYAHA